MSKVKLTITESRCRCGYVKDGDTFIVEDLCPPLCHELWNSIYPSVYALKNGAVLDYGTEKAKCFDAMCPDECRVHIHGEVLEYKLCICRRKLIMAKTQEELNAIKEEVEALNEKLAELTAEELKKVTGGVSPFGQNGQSDQMEFEDSAHWNPMLGSELT